MSDAPAYTRSNPIFVVGYKRSGTTLTCRLLLDHFRICFGSESQFIVRVSRKLNEYGDLEDERNLRRLFGDLNRERFFERTGRNFGFVLDIDGAIRSLRSRTYSGVLHAIFEQFAKSQGLQRWGDKTPLYSLHLPVIHQLFPEAQFVHVIRDLRDVTASVFKTGFGPKDPYDTAVEWLAAVDAARSFGSKMPPDQYLEFRYEDLLDDPAAALHRVARFIGVAQSDDLIARLRPALRAQVRAGNREKWRTELDRREVACLEGLAADRLTALGYPLVFNPPPPRPGGLERLMWRTRGVLRQVGKKGYWTDNWYKLRLRARDAGAPIARLMRG